MSSLRLDWCSHEAAKYATRKWHYSRTVPAGKVSRLGVWECERFIGVVLYGSGAGRSTDGRSYGLQQSHEVAELVRVALAPDHANPVSRIVAVSLRLIKKQSPKLRLVISFADEHNQGHHGGIYQAGNWIYAGRSAAGIQAYRVHGKKQHPKTVHARGWKQNESWLREHVDPNAEAIHEPGKHRYLYPLDDEMRHRIAPLAQPYPKRNEVQ